MVIAVDFAGLHAWAEALAVILLLELIVLLIVIAALTLVLMLGARWLQSHVIPLLNATVPRAKQALDITNQGTERVVRGVAEVHGWRSALEAGLKVFFQGREGSGTAQEPPLETGATGDQGNQGTARPDAQARWREERTPPPAAQAG